MQTALRTRLYGTWGKEELFQSRYAKPLVIIVVGVLFVAASAAVTTLTIPQVVILAQNAVTSSACGGILVLSGGPSPGTGTLRYNCPPTSGAFTVTTAGADTPTFNAPPEITSVGYVSHSALDCSGSTTLTSGTSTNLASTGDFDICAGYSCPTGCTIPQWTFSWAT